jgi:hypothetical protein
MKRFLTSRLGLLLTIFTFAAFAKLSGHYEALAFLPLFGTVDAAPGSPDYTYSTGTGNIPVKFATKSLLKFYDTAIIANVTNKDYVGELSSSGDEVVISTTPDITVRKHTKNTEHSWDIPSSDPIKMKVDRATIFAFRMDKIDLRQFLDKSYMESCSKDAGKAQAVYVDTEFLGEIYTSAHASNQGTTAGVKTAGFNLGVTGTPVTITKSNCLDYFVDCGTILDEQKIPKDGRFFVIPPWLTGMLKKSDLKDASMTGQASALMSGRLGMFDNWELFDSNLYTALETTNYPLIFGHKSAICFASDIIETAYFDKFENFAGKGMRGIQLYDWKVVKPDALGMLYAKRG